VGSVTSSAYNASKGAVLIFNKSTTIQYASENIRANSVHPGLVDSPMTRAHHDNPNIAQERVADMPLGRMGQPKDIAAGMSALRSRFGGTLTPVSQSGGE
jgi:NAD(P)-dependent dehydrogenase (short-subunit alcohol dehydrogenase family)